MFSIMCTLVKFRKYLVYWKFNIMIDHNNLRYFMNQKNLNDHQQKWVKKIQAYNFDIEYVKGYNNVIADALSCQAHINSIVSIIEDWKEDIIVEYAKDLLARGIAKG